MRFRRNVVHPAFTALVLLFAVLGTPPARAGLFDDDEARDQVQKLTTQHNEWVDTVTRAQFDMISQIQTLREENAKLRGQVELLTFELDAEKKRQQDFYLDLDTRLRKLEPQPASGSASAVAGTTVPTPAESHDYEAALTFFKSGKLKDAASALDAFGNHYPDSPLASNARYWLGNAHYALHDCKKAINVHKLFVEQWPQHEKSPDALISIAACQQELGETKNAKATLETLLNKYPSSAAAATAKQRLKK